MGSRSPDLLPKKGGGYHLSYALVPQYVCTNFSTFVCTTCSGIHREFTHRVKSVSMAKFSPQEISALQGGGNASAREIYLKGWDPRRNSLPDGSNIERLRDFIKHVYVDKRYTGERHLENPPRAKMGETEDSNGNRRIDSLGGSQSPPYDDTFERRYGDRSSSGGKSPAYDQDNRQSSNHKISPARAEVVNDWRREDRFGNGRKSDDRSSDGGSKREVRSPDSQRDSDMSSPPIVRPVRDILGDTVSSLRVIEPPKATGGRSADGWLHAQRTASSSSLASSDANPPEIKVEASFIDFDSVPDPPTVPPTQQAAADASFVQVTTSNGNDWANFESVMEVKIHAEPLSSVESVLSELLTPAPTSGLSVPVGKLPPFQSSASQGSSSGSSFGSATLPSVPPHGGAPAASFGPAPQLTNVEGSMLTNAPIGGQWPAMIPQQHFVFPGAISQPVSQLVTPVIGGSSSNKQPWNPLVPNVHGLPDASTVGVGQTEGQHAMGTSFGLTTESSLDAKSGGRKALPEDLFAMSYSYAPSPVSGWYSGSPYVAAVPMQYNTPVDVSNIYPVSRSINPFDVGNEPFPAQASTFPSVASLQGALPKTATPTGLLWTSSLETSPPHPPSMPTQAPAYGSAIPPSSFVGQGIAGSMAPSSQGQSGLTFEESAFASLNPYPQLSGLHSSHSASSNFPSMSGNPFG
ncbi:probable ADP-ribosylation factor GTPase-activating protein agd14 [Phtheirospermum japonicum]|uniref:Probable ADP-ribosylation factor GTPase-activating protein agd14 n=1 Tax=Phtheirospermum japonicum TaxID=374723 RepID=A0A830BIF5_9LAMI|nr:probable ADP-ribosylation factor GTPase-activating protein agd14 [Phtheirospermum japonicum]